MPGPKRFLRPGVPRINWRDPIAEGLLALYLPAISGQNLAIPGLGDLTNYGSANPGPIPTEEGMGLDCRVTNSGVWGSLPSAWQFASNVSFFVRFKPFGNPAGEPMLLGVLRGTGSNSVGVSITTGPKLDLFFNIGGTPHQIIGSLLTTKQMASAAGVYTPGSQVGYKNGAQDMSASIAGNLNYFSPTLQIGGFHPNGALSNTIITLGAIWSRGLSAAEVAALDADPYRLLLFPADWPIIPGGSAGSGILVTADRLLTAAWLGQSGNDAIASLSSDAAFSARSKSPVAAQHSTPADTPSGIEARANARRSDPAGGEASATGRRDFALPAASDRLAQETAGISAAALPTISGHAEAAFAALLAARALAETRAEWTGALSVVANALAPVEALANAARATILAGEALSAGIGFSAAAAEVLPAVLRRTMSPVSAQAAAVAVDGRSAAPVEFAVRQWTMLGWAAEFLTLGRPLVWDALADLEWRAPVFAGPRIAIAGRRNTVLALTATRDRVPVAGARRRRIAISGQMKD